MNITILGSGGFQTIPRPLCSCNVCEEARKKGIPYARNGPSIFVDEINTVFDTPKDIIDSINRENILKVDNIFYTHWHPDHTEGLRVVEEITKDWSKESPFKLKNHGLPIKVFAPTNVMEELKRINSPIGSYMNYFESLNLIESHDIIFDKHTLLNNIRITPIKNFSDEILTSTTYLIEEKDKKAVFMPCDVKPFETHKFLKDADLFIVGSPFFESEKGIQKIPDNHPLREELFSMKEIINLIKKYNIKRTIIVHIEEMWRLSFDELKELESKYSNYHIEFSFDGMKITL